MRDFVDRPPQVCFLGSADPGSDAYSLSGEAGEFIASLGYTLVSGCGSPATRVAAERAHISGGRVVSILPSDDINTPAIATDGSWWLVRPTREQSARRA